MKKEKNNKIAEKALLLSIFLAQIQAFCIKVTPAVPYLQTIELISFLLLTIISIKTFLTAKLKIRELIVVVLLLALGAVSYINTNSLTLSYLILLPFASRGVNFKKILKADLLSKVLTTSFIILCYFSHMTTNNLAFYRDGVTRESYGFAHPNTLGYISVIMCLELLYLLKAKTNSVLARVLAASMPILLCVLSGSRTALLVVIVTLLYSVFCAIREKYGIHIKKYSRRITRIATYLIPVIMVIISFVSSLAYGARAEWAIELNDALSGRISWQNYYGNRYDISLLGEDIGTRLKKAPLDNGYYRVMFNNGMLGLIALIVVIELSLAKSFKLKDGITPILIVLLFYGLSEWVVFRVIVTPIWSIAFAKTKEKNDEKKND